MLHKLEQTTDPYADCRDAIEVMENYFAAKNGATLLAMMKLISFDDNLEIHKESITSLTEEKLSVLATKEQRDVIKRSLPQYDLPSFRKWYMARVYGAV